MKSLLPLSLSILVIGSLGCDSKPDTLVTGGYDEAEMDAAMQRAVNEVDRFIKALQAGGSEQYGVKVPIVDGENTEYFWMVDISFDGQQFTGTIDNEPGMVSNIKMGQRYSVNKKEISDWMFMRDGKMYGNYTMRPLLATLPEAEAEMYRALFAEP